MSKHTKGPWLSVNGPCDDDFQCVCVVDHMTVCAKEVIGSAEDDARLIAAAPELLEALIDIANDYSERFDMESPSTNPGMKIVVENARAAIAKARGEA